MTPRDMAQLRLLHLQIESRSCQTPREVVTALGAIQAQDYLGALWAIGLRLPDSTGAAIERAIAERTIVRTWPMRGTLHFVAAEDVHWMLDLMTPRMIAGSAGRCKQLELDGAVFARSRKLFIRALEGGRQLTREAMFDLLERSRISTAGQRGIHILWRHAQEGLICFGPRHGKQFTFVLLDEWLPHSRRMERDAALAEIARRYFASHGPATLADFAGWTGLKVSDARNALEAVSSQVTEIKMNGISLWMPLKGSYTPRISDRVHLLPGFDEFLLGYKDRSAALDRQHSGKIVPGGNGMFMPTLVIKGRVAGTWKRNIRKNSVVITPLLFVPFNPSQRRAFCAAAERYGCFLGLTPEIVET